MKHNDWTEQLRQRLNDAEVPAPENLWDSISQQLDAQGQQQDAEDAQVAKKPHRVALLPWAAAASVVLIAGVGMWWQLRSNAPHIAMLEPAPHPITLTDNKAVNTKASAANTKASTVNSHISTTSTHAMLAYKDNALAPTASNKEEEVMALTMAEQEVQSEPIAEGAQRTTQTQAAHTAYHLPRTQHQASDTRWQVGVGTAGNMNRYESSGPIYVNSLSAVNTEYADNKMFRVSPYEQDTKDVTHHDSFYSFIQCYPTHSLGLGFGLHVGHLIVSAWRINAKRNANLALCRHPAQPQLHSMGQQLVAHLHHGGRTGRYERKGHIKGRRT